MKSVIFFSRALPGADLASLSARFDVRRPPPGVPAREALLADGAVEVLVTTFLDPVDARLVEALPRLRHVASYGVGINHLDVDACRRRGVLVTNTPGVLTDATADHAMALLLAAARRVVEGDRVIRRGGWTSSDPSWMLGTEVTGKTLGVVGFGRIGQAVARRARGFELRILYTSPREVDFPGARRVDLDLLLAESDFVSLNMPLTPATHDLLSRERIARMKRGAILVNTARGAVVDEDALAAALAEGRLAAAGLDVFRDEPRVPDALLRLENVVLTPHLGSGTRETRTTMSRIVLEEVERVARGEAPRFPVG